MNGLRKRQEKDLPSIHVLADGAVGVCRDRVILAGMFVLMVCAAFVVSSGSGHGANEGYRRNGEIKIP